ncbi:MAG: translation initiation factor IF-2 [Lachnospiraceae bacterium]|nr:translation initiation factor IF-2 [Lachnospiraceae bacterium]
MAKMRVHELAKELEIKSQDIIEALSTTEYAVKSAQSGIEDAAQELMRKKFAKSAKSEEPKTQAPKSEAVKSEAPKSETVKSAAPKTDAAKREAPKADAAKSAAPKTEDGKERPKKKSTITAVFNAQYSSQPQRRQGDRQRQGSRDGQDRGPRRDNGAQRQERGIIRPRPVGERAMRPISERTASNDDVLTAESLPTRGQSNRPQGDRPQRSDRPQGDRPQRSDRPQGDRPQRSDRPQGDRPQRSDRPQGDRPQRSDRPQGDRPRRPGDRPQGDRPQRSDRPQGGKPRFDRDAAPVVEDVRGKESRERKGSDRSGGSRHQDHDKLGSRRQENYVNLEKHGGKKKPQQPQQPKEDENVIKTITLPEKLTIKELADAMKIQPSAIVKKLFMKGQMVTVNQEVDFETAEEIALEFNFLCEAEEKIDVIAELLKEEEEPEETLVSRPPVVCVMGHVDHGKTSLLDAIRSTRVTDREAGGITQHIGASVVSINNQNITFLDTPGHEAFTAMRMRGANSTDIAILVVAADDGVMPQTVEAINHAKAAGVEIIVAVNKIDKPSANIDKVKQELSEYELIPEDWGGSTIFCPVSAHTKEGIDNLLEMILLTAEVLELKANPNRKARGLVIEAQLDKGRGAVATMLVQKGTMHVGDSIACGSSYGKIRAMIDDKGRRVKEATPSTPVEILGLNSVPVAGETFVCTESDKEAKTFAETYISEEKNKLLEDTKARMSLDDLFSQIQSGNMKELDIIVKADVQGSVEAVKQSLEKLSNEEVIVKVIHGGVGAINESDVILASASNAIIIGFNVRPDPMAKLTADRENVDVRLYKVIYNAIEDVEAAMKGMLDPVFEEKVLGHAEIRQIFKASGVGNIAGSYVLDGVLERGCKVRISREGEQIFEGDLASLKRFKDDVKEVKAGYECGLVFDGFNEIQELDQVEAYKMVEVPR